jgi:hypothetical protein
VLLPPMLACALCISPSHLGPTHQCPSCCFPGEDPPKKHQTSSRKRLEYKTPKQTQRSEPHLANYSRDEHGADELHEQVQRVDADAAAPPQDQLQLVRHAHDAQHVGGDGQKQRERLVALGGCHERDADSQSGGHRTEDGEAWREEEDVGYKG